jgi:hypothetical protein
MNVACSCVIKRPLHQSLNRIDKAPACGVQSVSFGDWRWCLARLPR